MNLTGYGLLQPGDRQQVLTNSEMGHKALSFMVLRDRWKYLQPNSSPNSINLDRLKVQIERCHKFNKGYIPAIMTGQDCTPDWIIGTRLNWQHDRRSYKNVLAPWLPIIPKTYENILQKLADLIENDPLNCGVWVNGPTVASQEMHTNGVHTQKGYSAALMFDNWRTITILFNSIFKKSNLIYSISGQIEALKYVKNVIEYAKATFPKERLAFQHNSLGKQTSVNSNHHKLLLQLEKEGYRVGSEQVQPGHTAGLSKFPQADYHILYPGDEKQKLPTRPTK